MHLQLCQQLDAELFRMLAWEDMLLDDVTKDRMVVVAWTGPPALVWGRNQCPWRECHAHQAERQGVQLARRVSGGGTVVQDAGCLNLTFLLPRSFYRAVDVYEVFRQLAHFFGVSLEQRDTSLYAGAHKVSGHAFAYRREGVLHHGTLLVNTDLSGLAPLLVSPFTIEQTHAVASNPAPVRNLHECTIPRLLDALPAALMRVWPDAIISPMTFPVNDPVLALKTVTYHSPSWIWERTPSFMLRLPAGGHATNTKEQISNEQNSMALTVNSGRISAFHGSVPATLQAAWRGLPLDKFAMLHAFPPLIDQYLVSLHEWVSSW